jgi:hypothetical protein
MMSTRRSALFALVLLGYLVGFRVDAQPPLPPLPPQHVITSVADATGGAAFVPLNALLGILNDLGDFLGGVTSALLDPAQSVHYIDARGTLRESVTPISNLAGIPLAPVVPLPGLPLRFGQVIGVSYQPATGPAWVVVTYKPLNSQPQTIRFYQSLTSYTEKTVYVGRFADPDGDNSVALVDSGAVMTQQRTCITVGARQICWEPDTAARKPGPARRAIKQALLNLHATYSFTATFGKANAVPDMLGKAQREACASHLAAATAFSAMGACKPNVFIAAATGANAHNLIAVMVVRSAVNVRTYDAGGAFVGDLPPGEYLVAAPPAAGALPGTATAVFLIGANGSTYLIPSTVLEGMSIGSQPDTGVAGIKDGFTRYRAFGW